MTINDAVEAAAEVICQELLFESPGHGCGGFCQAVGRYGPLAERILAVAYPELVAEIERLRNAAVSALTSMLIASKLPGVSDEYDFEPVIQEISTAINTMPRATLDAPKGDAAK